MRPFFDSGDRWIHEVGKKHRKQERDKRVTGDVQKAQHQNKKQYGYQNPTRPCVNQSHGTEIWTTGKAGLSPPILIAQDFCIFTGNDNPYQLELVIEPEGPFTGVGFQVKAAEFPLHASNRNSLFCGEFHSDGH